MSEALKLRCRCGWEGLFTPAQQGLAVSCPTCEREILVTRDAAEFALRNVGADDFELDLDVEPEGDAVTPPTTGKRAPTGRTRTRSTPGGRSIAKARPRKLYDQRLPNYAQHDRGARARPVTARTGLRLAPMVLGGLVFAALLVGFYVAMQRTGKASALAAARALVTEVAGAFGEGRFSGARTSFGNAEDFAAVSSGVRALFPADASIRLAFTRQREFEPGSSPEEPADYSAIFRASHEGKTYRLFLRATPNDGRWRISRASFRELTPGEVP
ncbi:MAG: hypothetical protein AB7O52_19200 [Planctomycetota bacterium]